MKLFFFVCLLIAAANAAQLQCDYSEQVLPFEMEVFYVCQGKITTSRTDYFVDGVEGQHITGNEGGNVGTNSEVNMVSLKNTGVTILPRNLHFWFTNFISIMLEDLPNYPNFKRSDFYDFKMLTNFYARNLPLVTNIPRDTFFDLEKLRDLMLDGMTNMENLHEDLLMKMSGLTTLSVRGPNKINQISPGFFRNQGNKLMRVDFTGTNLVKIGFTVFLNLVSLDKGVFETSGCINRTYEATREDRYIAGMITADVRTKCQDIILTTQNAILRNAVSSSSEETQWK